MKAIQFSQYGTAAELQLAEIPKPTPGPDDVLIRVISAGVNPADANLRSGRFKLFLKLTLPFIPGADVAGIVAAVGDSVTEFEPGQAVYAMIRFQESGGYAEYRAVPQSIVAPMPPNLTFDEAAGIPLAGLTALQAIEKAGALPPTARVLIYGASGGVGTLAVQIAKQKGATVTAVCSSRNHELVRKLGADRLLDYTKPEWKTHADQYDLVLDAAAALPLNQGIRLTAPGGTVVSLNPGFGNPLFKLWARLRGRRLDAFMVQPDANGLSQLSSWLAEGRVVPAVGHRFPLAEAAEAHRLSESKRARGKIVLQVDPARSVQTPPQVALPADGQVG